MIPGRPARRPEALEALEAIEVPEAPEAPEASEAQAALEAIASYEGLSWESLGRGGLKIAQLKDSFRFGEEQVLLAHWAADLIAPRKRLLSARGEKPLRVADAGCGSGILFLLLSALLPGSRGLGAEVMERPLSLARANIAANGLTGRFEALRLDLRQLAREGFPAEACPGTFDLVVGNPPYFVPGTGPARDLSTEGAREIAAAREERLVSLGEYMTCVAKWLAPGGQAAILQRPGRLTDTLREAERAGLTVTRLREILPRAGEAPSAFLLSAAKQPGAGFNWQRPLIIRRADGSYTNEVESFYTDPEAEDAGKTAGRGDEEV